VAHDPFQTPECRRWWPYFKSPNNGFASFKPAVPKPSVNHSRVGYKTSSTTMVFYFAIAPKPMRSFMAAPISLHWSGFWRPPGGYRIRQVAGPIPEGKSSCVQNAQPISTPSWRA
jgi:hypothetical protein